MKILANYKIHAYESFIVINSSVCEHLKKMLVEVTKVDSLLAIFGECTDGESNH